MVAALLTSTLVSACFPLAATTIGAGGLAIADRRTMGAQIEDQSIQVRANQRVKEVLPVWKNQRFTDGTSAWTGLP